MFKIYTIMHDNIIYFYRYYKCAHIYIILFDKRVIIYAPPSPDVGVSAAARLGVGFTMYIFTLNKSVIYYCVLFFFRSSSLQMFSIGQDKTFRSVWNYKKKPIGS